MCGRYTETKYLAKLRKRFGDRFQCEFPEDSFTPRYNISPSQDAPVILNAGGPVMRMLRWGLVPAWAKEEKIGYSMINAKAETVAAKPSYRNAFKKRRCLVVADGFYEWKRAGTVKLPHWFTLRDGEPFAFAGLWETWTRPDQSELQTFTIITTEPNELVNPCHNRMPVILPPESFEQWLDPEFQDAERLLGLLRPYAAAEMTATEVSTWVNSPRNEGARCIERLPADTPSALPL